jgi:hypothetical protein
MSLVGGDELLYSFLCLCLQIPGHPLFSGILVDMLIRLLYSQLHQFWNHFGSAIYEHASADFQVLRKKLAHPH